MPVTVREMTRRVEQDGWIHVRTSGSHRHFKHPTKPGTVTIPGKPSDTLRPGAVHSVLRQAGLKQLQGALMRYAVVIEKAEHNYSAYLPDVPGCITTGETVAETLENMKEALNTQTERFPP